MVGGGTASTFGTLVDPNGVVTVRVLEMVSVKLIMPNFTESTPCTTPRTAVGK